MRRGFLTASNSDKRASAVDEADVVAKPAAITELAKQVEQQLQVRDTTLITLPKSKDRTFGYQQANPYILRSDARFPISSSYFVYLPPSAKPGEADLVIVTDDVGLVNKIPSWTILNKSLTAAHQTGPFEIVDIPGKGLGLVATRAIRKGELICAERPLCFFPVPVETAGDDAPETAYVHRAALSRLAPSQQAKLMSLSFHHPKTELHEVLSRLNTNGLPALFSKSQVQGDRYQAVYDKLSRANHSCVPNANYFFDFESLTGRFYAARAIAMGGEITIAYTELIVPHADREVALMKGYGFTCSCDVCASPTASRLSDSNRKVIKTALTELGTSLAQGQLMTVAAIRQAIHLAEIERLHFYKLLLLDFGAQSLMRRNDPEASSWLSQAWQERAALEGQENPFAGRSGLRAGGPRGRMGSSDRFNASAHRGTSK